MAASLASSEPLLLLLLWAFSLHRLFFALFGHENLLNEFLTVLSLNLAPNEVSNRCPPLLLFTAPLSALHRLHIRRVVPSKLLWTGPVLSLSIQTMHSFAAPDISTFSANIFW